MKARISKQDGSSVSVSDASDECNNGTLRASGSCQFYSPGSDEYVYGEWRTKEGYSESVGWLDVLSGEGLVRLTLPAIDQPCASQTLKLSVRSHANYLHLLINSLIV